MGEETRESNLLIASNLSAASSLSAVGSLSAEQESDGPPAAVAGQSK
jgi:hypothetical protein